MATMSLIRLIVLEIVSVNFITKDKSSRVTVYYVWLEWNMVNILYMSTFKTKQMYQNFHYVNAENNLNVHLVRVHYEPTIGKIIKYSHFSLDKKRIF